MTMTSPILATAFMALSLTLALMNRGTMGSSRSILDSAPAAAPAAPPPPPTPSAPSN